MARSVIDLTGNIIKADGFEPAGVTAAAVIVGAGKLTTAGGDATETVTVTGVVATDIVIASIQVDGTGNVTLLQSVASADTVTFTLSANPGTDAIIDYIVVRLV